MKKNLIPTINISSIVKNGFENSKSITAINKIEKACISIGFFQVSGHGISKKKIEDICKVGNKFFKSSEKNKRKLSPKKWNPRNKNIYRGYFPNDVNGKEGLDIGDLKVTQKYAKRLKNQYIEYLNLNKCKELDVLPVSKDDLLKTSDFVSIHVVLGDRYKELIKLKEFDMMKKTAYLINTSRGPIVNEDDLIIALSTNVIAGAGIDVYEKEPLTSDHKLRFLPNALLLPHLGYVTAENYSIFYTQMIENLEACVNGKPIRVVK